MFESSGHARPTLPRPAPPERNLGHVAATRLKDLELGFYAPLRLDGRSNRVKLTVREYSDGSRRHYAVDFVDVGPAMVPGPPIGEATPTGMAGPTIVTLRDLLAGVNRDDGTPVFPAPSPHFSPWSWSARRSAADRSGTARSAMWGIGQAP